VIDILAGFGRRFEDGGALGSQGVERGLVDFPISGQVGFVDDEDVWDVADLGLHAVAEFERGGKRGFARAVGDEEEAGSAAEIAGADLVDLIFAGEVPEHQGDHLVFGGENFFVGLNADGGVVFVAVGAGDKAGDEAGFPDRESAEHADFFLDHGLQTFMDGEPVCGIL
jgi:hypothetical protein